MMFEYQNSPKMTNMLQFLLIKNAIATPNSETRAIPPIIYNVIYIVLHNVIYSNSRNTNIVDISIKTWLFLHLQVTKSKPHFRKLVKIYRRPTGKPKTLANMQRHTGESDEASCLLLSLL